ncbi:MAG: FAD-binding oxidoreductase [Rhodobacteraceae bacterium]|nr:FAD-binding oxidoreductase [Paracoccaceae bacterium]MBR9821124.1 FAD-binding oxidoreductase [Paracoccaceae bacterium]
MQETDDVLVIGAGIAGLSVAAALSETCRVTVLERETSPGNHASGRAAALFRRLHPQPTVRLLTEASLPFLSDRHEEVDGAPLVNFRGLLLLARGDQMDLLDRVERDPRASGILQRLDASALARLVPQLRPGYAASALLEDDACDINVPRLMTLFRRRLAARAGRLVCGAGVSALRYQGGAWLAETGAGVFRAPVLVNAAGAWADGLARLAGITPIGLTARRRTLLEVRLAGAERLRSLPMIADLDLHFYFKPEAGRFLISPADETPARPGNALPEDLDVTLCLDRIRACFDFDILETRRVWAGLRSYAPDGMPVLGFDAAHPGFYWLAGQGAAGIQTAPSVAGLAAAEITGAALPPELDGLSGQRNALLPGRFAEASPFS